MRFDAKLTKIGVCLVLIMAGAALTVGTLLNQQRTPAKAANNCQYFSETGHQVCGQFLDYWNNHGGLAQQGYPVSDVFSERNAAPPAGDGMLHNVQYFQRARFEEHLESSTNPVQLGLLGSEQYGSKYSTPPQSVQGLTIKSSTTVSQINGTAAGSGDTFLVVEVSLTNNSGNSIGTNPAGFTLTTDETYPHVLSAQTHFLDNAWASQILGSGQTQTGKIAFEIPTSAQPKTLTFTYSDFKAVGKF